eukprot:3276245-Rhodomonas_salina.1
MAQPNARSRIRSTVQSRCVRAVLRQGAGVQNVGELAPNAFSYKCNVVHNGHSIKVDGVRSFLSLLSLLPLLPLLPLPALLSFLSLPS